MDTFQYWVTRIGVPWPAVKIHLEEAMAAAREKWPELIQALPMSTSHKVVLREHLSGLQPDFRIEL